MTWRSGIIGDFVSLQRGHDLTEDERQDGEVPIIGSAGPNGFHNVALSLGPGVTIGRSGGSIGKVTFVDQDFWPHNTCIYVTDFKGNDPALCGVLVEHYRSCATKFRSSATISQPQLCLRRSN